MAFSDKVIAVFSPERAYRRQQFRALYEGATPRKHDKDKFKLASSDPNVDRAMQGSTLRARARYLDQNSDLITGLFDVLCTHIVGSGMACEPTVKMVDGTPAQELNDAICRRHTLWAERPDVTRSYNLAKAEQLACRTWLRDGEAFIQHVNALSARHPRAVNVRYSFELIEADQIPEGFTERENRIYQGIRRNAWGAAERYYLSVGDTYTQDFENNTRSIKAGNMEHIANITRFKQNRGVPLIASAINTVSDLDDYANSERVAAKMAAAFVGSIEHPKRDTGIVGAGENKEIPIAPGAVGEFFDGTTFKLHAPQRPNTAFGGFIQHNGRLIAAGNKVSYSSLTKDYNGTYSSQRQEMVEQFGIYRPMQNEFIDKVSLRLYKRFIFTLEGMGYFDEESPNFIGVSLQGVDMDTLYDVSFQPPQPVWIDPLREANAAKVLMESRVKSRRTTQRGFGLNFRHEDELMRQDDLFAGVDEPPPDEPDDEDE